MLLRALEPCRYGKSSYARKLQCGTVWMDARQTDAVSQSSLLIKSTSVHPVAREQHAVHRLTVIVSLRRSSQSSRAVIILTFPLICKLPGYCAYLFRSLWQRDAMASTAGPTLYPLTTVFTPPAGCFNTLAFPSLWSQCHSISLSQEPMLSLLCLWPQSIECYPTRGNTSYFTGAGLMLEL